MKLSRLTLSIIASLLLAALTYFWSMPLLDSLDTFLAVDPATISATLPVGNLTSQLPRAAFVMVILGIISYLIWKNWSRNFLWMAIGAVIYGLLFHFRYGVIAERTYSLASVTGADELFGFTASTSLVSLAIPWWVLFTYLGVFKMESRRAAEIAFELTFAVLLLLALPIGWSFIVHGANYFAVGLRDSNAMFLGFLCTAQVMVVSLFGLVISGGTFLMARSQSTAQPASMSGKRRKQ